MTKDNHHDDSFHPDSTSSSSHNDTPDNHHLEDHYESNPSRDPETLSFTRYRHDEKTTATTSSDDNYTGRYGYPDRMEGSSGISTERLDPAPSTPYGYQVDRREENDNSTDVTNGRNISNWPGFLIPKNNQLFFSIISMIVAFATGAGILLPGYYLFILDDSVDKNTGAKIISWIAFIVPLMIVIITLIAAFVAGIAAMMGGSSGMHSPIFQITLPTDSLVVFLTGLFL